MSEEKARARIASWLEPIAGGATPAGDDARYDPMHEGVRNEAAKLEAPAGGQPNWQQIVRDGGELTQKKSKDLLIESYMACALWQTEGLLGLGAGLLLMAETMDRYWADMQPPAKRLRARANAIDWLVGRTTLTLADTPLKPDDHGPVAALDAGAKRLRDVINARFEDQAPAFRPLTDAIDRLKMSLPPAADAGAAPPPPAGEPAPPPASADPGTAPAPTSEPTAAAPVAAPAGAPAAPPPEPAKPPEPEKVDYAAKLAKLAEPWTQPIPGASPAGIDAKYEPEHESLRADIAAFESPTGTDLKWPEANNRATTILKDKSKDLLIASYMAFGLFQTKGIEGLATGLEVINQICEKYWEDCQPPVKRLRGRANGIAWLLQRVEGPLPEVKLKEGDFPTVELLEIAAKRLSQIVRDKFEDTAPPLRPLLDNVTRLKASVPIALPPEPPPPVQAAPAPRPAAAPAAPKPAGAAVTAPTLTAPVNVGDIFKFTTPIMNAAATTAKTLRAAAPGDPAPYRLLRIAIHLDTHEGPIPRQGNKSGIRPPPPDMIADFRFREQSANWPALLEAVENVLPQRRYWLDLHRYASVAMQNIGESHAAANVEAKAAVGFMILRFPTILDLAFEDGTPFASDIAKQWIAAEVMPVSTGGGGGGGGGGPGADERLGEAGSLIASGKREDGLALLQQVTLTGKGGRTRFLAMLELGKALAGGKTGPVADGVFEGLLRMIDEVGLEEWEPELAGSCYRGYLDCLKAMEKGNDPGLAERRAVVYRRLCRLDPVAASKQV